MSQKEFASVVIDSRILTSKEVDEMMKHFNDASTFSSPLNFIQAPRMDNSPIVHRRQRFGTFIKPPDTYRRYGTWVDNINFTVNKPVMLKGVQLFGSEVGTRIYRASIEMKAETSKGPTSLVKLSGTYASEKDQTYDYYGFDVLFDRPVFLKDDKEYELISFTNGGMSWYGTEGQTLVECQGVQFTFRRSLISNNATSDTKGQFPAFLFATFPPLLIDL